MQLETARVQSAMWEDQEMTLKRQVDITREGLCLCPERLGVCCEGIYKGVI